MPVTYSTFQIKVKEILKMKNLCLNYTDRNLGLEILRVLGLKIKHSTEDLKERMDWYERVIVNYQNKNPQSKNKVFPLPLNYILLASTTGDPIHKENVIGVLEKFYKMGAGEQEISETISDYMWEKIQLNNPLVYEFTQNAIRIHKAEKEKENLEMVEHSTMKKFIFKNLSLKTILNFREGQFFEEWIKYQPIDWVTQSKSSVFELFALHKIDGYGFEKLTKYIPKEEWNKKNEEGLIPINVALKKLARQKDHLDFKSQWYVVSEILSVQPQMDEMSLFYILKVLHRDFKNATHTLSSTNQAFLKLASEITLPPDKKLNTPFLNQLNLCLEEMFFKPIRGIEKQKASHLRLYDLKQTNFLLTTWFKALQTKTYQDPPLNQTQEWMSGLESTHVILGNLTNAGGSVKKSDLELFTQMIETLKSIWILEKTSLS